MEVKNNGRIISKRQKRKLEEKQEDKDEKKERKGIIS